MHITINGSHSPEQNIQIITDICGACLLHEHFFDLLEHQNHLIEKLPFSTLENQNREILFSLEMTGYDLKKMRLVKQRFQLIKELITTYTQLTVDRTACIQSPTPQFPYTVSGIMHLGNIVRKSNLSALELFYIREYTVLSTLCMWRGKTMNTQVIGDREALLGNKKVNNGPKKQVHIHTAY